MSISAETKVGGVSLRDRMMLLAITFDISEGWTSLYKRESMIALALGTVVKKVSGVPRIYAM